MLYPHEEEKYHDFIKKYCQRYSKTNPRAHLTNATEINIHWNRLLKDYKEVNQDAIKRYLQSKSKSKSLYRNIYLTTYWWYIIRHKRMLMDGFLCTKENCDIATRLLEVHHRDYEHLGEEVKFMDDIVTLCPNCHDDEHGKKRKKRKFRFGKRSNEIVLTKTEEYEDPLILQKFEKIYDEMVFEDTTISADSKNYIITITTQTPTTEELQTAILNNLDILLTALD